MVQAVRAVIDEHGNVRLLEKVTLSNPTGAFVLIVSEDEEGHPQETLLLSEGALGKDWSRPEEDQAWSFLQSAT